MGEVKKSRTLLQCEENKGKCLYAVQAEDKMEPAMEMTDRQEHVSHLCFSRMHINTTDALKTRAIVTQFS